METAQRVTPSANVDNASPPLNPGQAMTNLALNSSNRRNHIPLAVRRDSATDATLPAIARVLPPLDCFDASLLKKNNACSDPTMRGQSSIDWRFQEKVARIMRRRPVVAASFVAIDIKTGEIRALLSHETQQNKASREALHANAPAASVFKIVTAVALVQKGLTAESSVCTHGGHSSIDWNNLKDNKNLDHCEPLRIAFAKSRNSAFAKLSDRKLRISDLQNAATALGFNSPIPFELPLTRSHAEVPGHRLKRARMAAGFAAVSLNPIHAALMAATIVRGGTFPLPTLFKDANKDKRMNRVMSRETAREVRKMMAATVTSGTGRRTLGKARIRSGAKSGTLSAFRNGEERHNTWMVGYFPEKNPKIAFAALVVNDDVWHIRAADLARYALDAYAMVHRR
jgi:cell division protein FtsI/penicillin-binding protein 2